MLFNNLLKIEKQLHFTQKINGDSSAYVKPNLKIHEDKHPR